MLSLPLHQWRNQYQSESGEPYGDLHPFSPVPCFLFPAEGSSCYLGKEIDFSGMILKSFISNTVIVMGGKDVLNEKHLGKSLLLIININTNNV